MKKLLCILLVLCLLSGNVVSAFAEGTGRGLPSGVAGAVADAGDIKAPSPEAIKNAVEAFTKAITESSAKPGEFAELSAFITRFAGIASSGVGAVNGAIAVLTLLGVMENPQKKALAEILSEVKNVQDQLREMDTKLDSLSKQLIDLAVITEEKDRQNRAAKMLSYWRTFNTSYVEPLANKVTEYQGYINRGLSDWWKETSHDGVRLLYTSTGDGILPTFANKPYSAAVPAKSDNGETILAEKTVGVPSDCMPATAAEEFNVNTYAGRLKQLAAQAILSAADGGKLEASEAFYSEWKGLDDNAKKSKADSYAQDLLNAVIYRVACKAMSENDTWVISVINAYKNYCSNIIVKDSGIDALINAQYLTHGFEGEVSEEIKKIGRSMIATAGFYGSFAVSVAGQDSLQTDAARTSLRDTWVATINYIEQKRDASLTGMPNYCYIAGAVVDFTSMKVSSEMTSVYKYHYGDPYSQVYNSFSSKPWQVTNADGGKANLPALLHDTWSMVLYRLYQHQKNGNETFQDYLIRNGVNIPKDFNAKLMTSYGGAQTFSLADGLQMKAKTLYGDTYKDGNTYSINTDKTTKPKDIYFTVHDKVVCNYLDPSTGELLVNQVCTARAAYLEQHWFWCKDEAHILTQNADVKVDQDKIRPSEVYTVTDKVQLTAPLYMLSLSKAPRAAGEPSEDPVIGEGGLYAESALDAFDNVSYMPLPEEPEEEPNHSETEWSADDFELVGHFTVEDENVNMQIQHEIEKAVQRAEQAGLKVSLSDQEKEQLSLRMKEMIRQLQGELEKNTSILYLDVFEIGEDDDALQALAKAVLQNGEPDSEEETQIDPDNINTAVMYEAGAAVHFVQKDDRVESVVNPAFEIKPILLIWDPVLQEAMQYEISDEVMAAQGLTAKLRIPAASVNDQKDLVILHYDNYNDFNQIGRYEVPVQGEGVNRYAEISVNRTSPFELVLDTSTIPAPATGPADSFPWLFLFLASASAAAVLAIRMRRRETAC